MILSERVHVLLASANNAILYQSVQLLSHLAACMTILSNVRFFIEMS